MKAGGRILVVDDNETAAEGMRKLLTLRGYEVVMVHDGESALRMADSFKPEAVLLDIGLPDMTGYDVCRRLREEHAYWGTIVALSGYGSTTVENDNPESAAFDFQLVKPAGLAEIEAVLAQVS